MTRILEALDYSRPVQPLFAKPTRMGRVHSIFPGALNIAADETLFSLLSDEKPRMPNSARLPRCIMEQLYSTLSPGMQVFVGDGRLLIPVLDLSIHLPDSEAWEPMPRVAAHNWRSATVTERVHLLAQHLARRGQQDGLAPLVRPLLLREAMRETPLGRIALPLLRLLVQASREQDMANVEKAARGLAGLGPGLTPSGDDTLGGFIGVLALTGSQSGMDATAELSIPTSDCRDAIHRVHLCCEGKGRKDGGRDKSRPYRSSTLFTDKDGDWAANKHLAEVIASAARPRTTLLSATLLAHAARGEMAEQAGELLMALPVETEAAVLQAAERVLAYGACSGGDTLLGLLLGVQAIWSDYPVDDIGDDYGDTGAAEAEHVL